MHTSKNPVTQHAAWFSDDWKLDHTTNPPRDYCLLSNPSPEKHVICRWMLPIQLHNHDLNSQSYSQI